MIWQIPCFRHSFTSTDGMDMVLELCLFSQYDDYIKLPTEEEKIGHRTYEISLWLVTSKTN